MCFAPQSDGRPLPPLTDEEIRWLHGDESAGIKPQTCPCEICEGLRETGRAMNVNIDEIMAPHLAPQIPENGVPIPLVRLGQGEFTRDIHAGAVFAPRTEARTPRRRGWLGRLVHDFATAWGFK